MLNRDVDICDAAPSRSLNQSTSRSVDSTSIRLSTQHLAWKLEMRLLLRNNPISLSEHREKLVLRLAKR